MKTLIVSKTNKKWETDLIFEKQTIFKIVFVGKQGTFLVKNAVMLWPGPVKPFWKCISYDLDRAKKYGSTGMTTIIQSIGKPEQILSSQKLIFGHPCTKVKEEDPTVAKGAFLSVSVLINCFRTLELSFQTG